jgi:hypothetical protein
VKAATRELAAKHLRGGTPKQYGAALLKFRNFSKLPAVEGMGLPERMCAFAVYAQVQGQGPRGPRTAWAALRDDDAMNAFSNTPAMDFGSPRQQKMVEMTFKGLEETGTSNPLYRRPLTWEAITAVVRTAAAHPDRHFGETSSWEVTARTLAALVLTALQALLRSSEYLSPTSTSFDNTKGLSWSRVQFFGNGVDRQALLGLVNTKTQRVVEVMVDGAADKNFSAVNWLEQEFERVDPGADMTATAVFRTANYQPLRPQVAIAALRLLWDAYTDADIDWAGFLLHSIRILGAIVLCMAGATIEQRRVRGGWATGSNVVLVYAERRSPGGPNVMQAAMSVSGRISSTTCPSGARAAMVSHRSWLQWSGWPRLSRFI